MGARVISKHSEVEKEADGSATILKQTFSEADGLELKSTEASFNKDGSFSFEQRGNNILGKNGKIHTEPTESFDISKDGKVTSAAFASSEDSKKHIVYRNGVETANPAANHSVKIIRDGHKEDAKIPNYTAYFDKDGKVSEIKTWKKGDAAAFPSINLSKEEYPELYKEAEAAKVEAIGRAAKVEEYQKEELERQINPQKEQAPQQPEPLDPRVVNNLSPADKNVGRGTV